MINAAVAVQAFSALAQENRLMAFRLLVEAGEGGRPAGVIAEALGLPCSSLSFHLAQLEAAGLVGKRRDGRRLIYTARFDAVDGLVAFLLENCCAGAACVATQPAESFCA